MNRRTLLASAAALALLAVLPGARAVAQTAATPVPAGEKPKWPPISSHEYLQERLREIKLK